MAGDATAGVAEHRPAAAPVTAQRTQRVAITIVFFLAGLVAGVWAAGSKRWTPLGTDSRLDRLRCARWLSTRSAGLGAE
jgi:hypothetical protein